MVALLLVVFSLEFLTCECNKSDREFSQHFLV